MTPIRVTCVSGHVRGPVRGLSPNGWVFLRGIGQSMHHLFDVKDWDVPPPEGMAESSSKTSKKRKRSANDSGKVQSAQVNIEKLMRTVERGAFRSRHEQKKSRRNQPQSDAINPTRTSDHNGAKSWNKKLHAKVQRQGNDVDGEIKASLDVGKPSSLKRADEKSSRTRSTDRVKTATDNALPLSHEKALNKPMDPSVCLTTLQSSMKDTLDGARFRWRLSPRSFAC